LPEGRKYYFRLKLNIAILGTRGIPNHYGGYEQAVSYLAPALVEKGHTVTVYNTHDHPYKESVWRGVSIRHCSNPEKTIGATGQFIYDLNCIRHARQENFDVLLFMGYTSSSIWGSLYPKNAVIISNMDGLEWKREKYNALTRRFLKFAEKLAVNYSDYHIADSKAIRDYLDRKYEISSAFIPYGACPQMANAVSIIKEQGVEPGNYSMLIARMEPENNVHTILEGFAAGKRERPMLVIGNHENNVGRKLLKRFGGIEQVRFMGAVYDQQLVGSLRAHCNIYFHGHSVGGTNPSLLEAMASGALIAAHDNPFNKQVLGHDALYFASGEEVSDILDTASQYDRENVTKRNMEKIVSIYNWERITEQYEALMIEAVKNKRG
jgi:glycosyltransferase involved in cell wall biosynthesis